MIVVPEAVAFEDVSIVLRTETAKHMSALVASVPESAFNVLSRKKVFSTLFAFWM